MADDLEAPLPSESLEVDRAGRFVVREYKADGTFVAERQVSNREALRFLNQLVSLYGADNSPLRSGGDAVFTKEQLQANFLEVLNRIWLSELQGSDEAKALALAEILKAAVTNPEAIALLESRALPRAYLRIVWPDLDERLQRPVDGEDFAGHAPLGIDEGTSTSDRQITGAERTGPDGVPVAATPPGGSSVAGTGAGAASASGGSASDAARAADPVLPFTGQLLVEASDLELDGIGIDIEFRRTYLHNVSYTGPLGPRWDHSYNLWLREALEPHPGGGYEYVVYRSAGLLRMERYSSAVGTQDIDFGDITAVSFNQPAGTVTRLEKRDGRFVAITPDGREFRYNDNLVAESIRDAYGNEVRLLYDDRTGELGEIVDTCNRRVRLEYDGDGRLCHLFDHSLGRHVWYGYDENGLLQTVRKSVDDTGATTLVAAYRYWGDGAPAGLTGNILALIDGRGVEVLQVRYGDQPGFLSYNRVVEQRDGGVTLFEYEFAGDVEEEDRTNAAVIRVRMTLPTRDIHILEYSHIGRLVRLQVDDRNPLNPASLVTRWRYSEDGAVVREDRPDGSATAYVYGREMFTLTRDAEEATPEERAAFSQLRRIVEYAQPGGNTPPTRVTEYDYHPVHGLVTERRGPYYGDALGHRIGGGPVWQQRFEYDALGSIVAMRAPACTLPDGSLQAGSQVTFTRDARGRLVRREAPLDAGVSLVTEFVYDTGNDPQPQLEILDPGGLHVELRYVHDAAGRTVEARDPNGVRVTTQFDHLGRTLREEVRQPGHVAASTTIYEYQALALPSRVRRNRLDARGIEEPGAELIEEFSFDADGDVASSRLRSADGSVDRVMRVNRGSDRRASSVTLNGRTLETRYDARGRAIETWLSAGDEQRSRHRRYGYDAGGRLARIVDAVGNDTRMQYDGFGRLALVRQSGGSLERFEWDEGDRLLSHEVTGRYPGVQAATQLSEETREYDEIGRLVRRTEAVFDPLNPLQPRTTATAEMTYDRADRVVSMKGTDGSLRTIRYDALSRIVDVTDGVATSAHYTFDDVTGRQTEEITVTGSDHAGLPVTHRTTVTRKHDALGRIVEEIDPLGNTLATEYDSQGSVKAIVDPLGFRSEWVYFPDGQTRSIAFGAGTGQPLAWSYRRDSAGRLSGIDGPRGTVLALTRDRFERIETIAMGPAPDRETVAIARDAEGRIIRTTEATGVVTALEYGPAGRLERLTIAPPPQAAVSARSGSGDTVQYEFDGAGRLVLADDGVRPVHRRYDSRGLLLEERSGGATTRWSYDVAGRPTAFVFPDGRRIEFERSSDGRLTRVLDQPPGAAAASEMLRLWTLGSQTFVGQEWRGAIRRTDTIDPAGRLSQVIERRIADGAAILEIRQLADARGFTRARRVSVNGVAETMIADTDAHGRLVSISFDPAAAIQLGAPATQADLDVLRSNVEGAFSAGAEEIAVGLDPDGARRTYTRRMGGAVVEERQYSVDLTGRSVETGRARVDDLDGLPVQIDGDTLRYDAWRRLTRVDRNGAAVVEIAYDALGRIARVVTAAASTDLLYTGHDLIECHADNVQVAQFVRLPGGTLVESGLPRAPARALVDGQGSLVGLSDGNALAAVRLWDPFGEPRQTTGVWATPGPSFQNLLGVPGIDLLLTPARSYDPRAGAFREPDPMGFPDGLNRRIYAAGNPLAFCDPTGLMAQPSNMTGRPRPEGLGYAFGHGRFSPEDNAFWRGALAMAGALSAVGLGIIDFGKMMVDVAGLSADLVSGGRLDYQAKSGIGQAAAQGKVGGGLDVFSFMGKSIIETPGRAWQAAERSDWGSFGAEALNSWMLIRAGAGVASGTAKVSGNLLVKSLGAFGPRGLALRAAIRTRQLEWMRAEAVRLAGVDEAAFGQPSLRYAHRLPNGALGKYSRQFDYISLSEAAFRPFGGLRSYQGTLPLLQARWEIGNILRGNFTLRTLVHEYRHRFQWTEHPAEVLRWQDVPYLHNPMEFAAPPSVLAPLDAAPWGLGAWDFEMTVPAGPFSTAVGVCSALEHTDAPRNP